jgi:hypothetical protein
MSNGASDSVIAPGATSILLDLAPGGVCQAIDIAAYAGSLLHYRFTLAGF